MQSLRVLSSPSVNSGGGGVNEVVRRIAKHTKHRVVSNIAEADLVHLHGLAEHPGKSDVYTSHGIYFPADYPNDPESVKNNLVMVNRMKQARFSTAVAAWAADFIKEQWGVELIHIPNGVDRAEVQSAREHKIRWVGLDLSKPFFLYLGYWNRVKNPLDILAVAGLLPEFNFVLSCAAPDGLSYPSNVLFSAELPHSTALTLLHRAQALISPFIRENCSMATLEAYGADKPVIGRRGGGNQEMILPGRTGLLYDTVEELKTACISVVAGEGFNKKEIYGMTDIYAWPKIAARYDYLYEGCIEDIPVSCIVLAYNDHKLLRRALDSIPDSVEIILVDASNNHENVLPHRKNIKRVTTDNISIGDNRTAGLRACTREFVTMLDADDYAYTSKWSLYKYLDDPSLSMVFADCGQANPNFPYFSTADEACHVEKLKDGAIISSDVLSKGNRCPSGSVMFRRSTALGCDFGHFNFGEDYLMWLKLAHLGKARYVNYPVYMYCGSSLGLGHGDKPSALKRNSPEEVVAAFKEWKHHV